jgi:hypothetical protein
MCQTIPFTLLLFWVTPAVIGAGLGMLVLLGLHEVVEQS